MRGGRRDDRDLCSADDRTELTVARRVESHPRQLPR
jgi:hypothetical protein